MLAPVCSSVCFINLYSHRLQGYSHSYVFCASWFVPFLSHRWVMELTPISRRVKSGNIRFGSMITNFVCFIFVLWPCRDNSVEKMAPLVGGGARLRQLLMYHVSRYTHHRVTWPLRVTWWSRYTSRHAAFIMSHVAYLQDTTLNSSSLNKITIKLWEPRMMIWLTSLILSYLIFRK